ncbi:MAG: CPBP family intramembrane metalloprotease [Agathobacter sp.]|nr:CPBP family intramembrane metalloprotease [Agathobacter sp.]
MKKITTLLFSSVPFFLAIGIQFVAVYYLLFIASVFLFNIAPAIQGKIYTEEDLFILASDMNFNTIASIIFSVSCITVFAIWYYKSCGGNFKINLKKDFHPYEILGLVLLVPGSQFMSSIVTSMISLAFPNWLEDYMELIENAGLSGEVPLLMMIYSVCLAPIGEELIFRGVTYRIARRAFPFWIANIIQAFLFGVFHMNPLQGCYTFILGLFMGYICEKGVSLYHAIFFHFLFNLWGTTASQWLTLTSPELQGLLVIIGTIVGLTGGFHFFNLGTRIKRT